MKHDALKEKALANFELLLEFWKVDFKRITGTEYDLLATWREDKNFGSCRFNVEKGIGSDFANYGFTKEDIKLFGAGFDESDFVGFTVEDGATKPSFDIVGLCQRIYRCRTYQDASKYLDDDLRTLAKDRGIIVPTEERIKARLEKEQRRKQKNLEYAVDLWESSKYHPLVGSIGERYLNSRGIFTLDKNIRFHPSIPYGPLRVNYPCLLFKVQNLPNTELVGVHRIYLSNEGKKAPVENPKAILGSLKSNSIWFGEPSSKLYIAEGPENSLTCLEQGAKFVCCSISAHNLLSINIPNYVTNIVLVPDPDPIGLSMVERFRELKRHICKNSNLKIEQVKMPLVKNKKGKYMDLNELHTEGIE